jgi:hypothetical protein
VKEQLHDALAGALVFAKALVPGALGAAVAVAVQTTLTWTQRFVQIAVGIIVSYYAGEAAAVLMGAEGVLKNAIGFTAGVGAFETAKALRTSIAEVARTAPKQAWEWWLARIGGIPKK